MYILNYCEIISVSILSVPAFFSAQRAWIEVWRDQWKVYVVKIWSLDSFARIQSVEIQQVS